MLMLNWTQTVTAEQLRQLDPAVRILVAHPQLKSHQPLIEHFLETYPAAYLKLQPQIYTVEDVESALQAAFEAQGIPKTKGSHNALILDNGDQISPDVLIGFLQAHLRKHRDRLILYCARQYPAIIEQYPTIETVARLWPVSNERMLLDYPRRDRSRRLVEVYAYGGGRVVVDGVDITGWRGSLPWRLFFYFIDRGLLTRSQIFDTIWPGLPVKEATNVFHVTKRKINEILGLDLTTYWGGYYRLSQEIDLVYDVSIFIEQLQASAVAQDEDSLAHLENCLAAYRADFLAGTALDWVEQRREELRLMQSESLAAAARLQDQRQNPELAIGRYARAYGLNPARSEFAKSLSRLYTANGRKEDANHIRELLKTNEGENKA
jgi:DNA-binding SARP family transcriptional activator